MELFSLKMRLLRKEKGLNQQDLADLLADSNQQQISRWESGVIPSISQVKELAEVLNVDYLYLLNDELNLGEISKERAEFNNAAGKKERCPITYQALNQFEPDFDQNKTKREHSIYDVLLTKSQITVIEDNDIDDFIQEIYNLYEFQKKLGNENLALIIYSIFYMLNDTQKFLYGCDEIFEDKPLSSVSMEICNDVEYSMVRVRSAVVQYLMNRVKISWPDTHKDLS